MTSAIVLGLLALATLSPLALSYLITAAPYRQSVARLSVAGVLTVPLFVAAAVAAGNYGEGDWVVLAVIVYACLGYSASDAAESALAKKEDKPIQAGPSI